MAHANARLTPAGRQTLVTRITVQGRPAAHVAAEMGVSRTTAYRWVARYKTEGNAGLHDRPSTARTHPHRTPPEAEQAVIQLRMARKLGPVRIAAQLGLAASTVHRVLARHGMQRLAFMDRPTGQPIRAPARRYERARPGELVHIDVKKLGRLRPGGGHRAHGRDSVQHRTRDRRGHARPGWEYVHAAVDDHSRLAYIEILPDERGITCAGFLRRAVAWYAAYDVRVQRVMSDNAFAYRHSHAFQQAVAEVGAVQRFIRPGRPETNGKVERLNRTMLEEWAYQQPYASNEERAAALPAWLHTYNMHRAHTALGGRPPITRINNPAGQYN